MYCYFDQINFQITLSLWINNTVTEGWEICDCIVSEKYLYSQYQKYLYSQYQKLFAEKKSGF